MMVTNQANKLSSLTTMHLSIYFLILMAGGSKGLHCKVKAFCFSKASLRISHHYSTDNEYNIGANTHAL